MLSVVYNLSHTPPPKKKAGFRVTSPSFLLVSLKIQPNVTTGFSRLEHVCLLVVSFVPF